MLKNKLQIISLLLCTILVFSGIAMAGIEEDIKNEVPASWFEAPKLASELGITSFNQSPMLNEKVTSGELPAVEKRLPADPPVIEPLNQVGEYGGTHTVLDTDLSEIARDLLQLQRVNFFRPDPIGSDVVPSLARGYEFSEDATEFTLYIREGIKWSDGNDFNADDVMYWWEAEANNEDINPIAPEDWTPVGWQDVEKIDDYTVKITFNKPNPLFVLDLRNNLTQVVGFNPQTIGTPAHYLKQYHPDYTDDIDKLNQLIEEEGFEEWYQLYGYIKEATHPKFDAPSLKPYVIADRSATSTLWKRNPYFPFVDTAGNQLPYVDEVREKQIQDWTIYHAKAVTGEGTFVLGRTAPDKLPMYKGSVDKENYNLILATKVHSAQVRIMPNLNHTDAAIREIMQKVEFRRALSLAINRNEINQTFYFGMAEPYPVTVHPASPYYKESFNKYIDFKPEEAKELLDEIGVVDHDGDGWRDLPNGDSFNLTIEFFEYGSAIPKIVQMVIDQWQEVGLKFNMKVISGALWDQRARSSKIDMSVFAYPDAGPLAFPIRSYASSMYVPTMMFPLYSGHWVEWCRWNVTNGEEGTEPPAEIKELIEWYNIARTTTDDQERIEMGQKILEVNAEKVWSIGTVARWPHPFIINDNLRNAVNTFIMGSDMEGYYPYYSETMFFEGGEAAM